MTTRAFQMMSPNLWDDETMLIDHMAGAVNEGRLALVLGAGLSIPFGLPDWTTLLQRLYAAHGEVPPAGRSLLDQAEYFFGLHYAGKDAEGNQAVRSALYETFSLNFDELRKNGTMSAIGALVMSSVRGHATCVVTFNFDDLLEAYLEFHGFVVDSVSDEQHLSRNADVVVYHPHGLLSSKPGGTMSSEIVFDRQKYSQIVGIESRPWRQLMLSMLRTRLCVFIGLSGDDDNLDSFLVRLNEIHGYREARAAYWGVHLSVNAQPVEDARWKKRGVYPKKVASYDTGLPHFLFKVCQEAARLRSEGPSPTASGPTP